MITVETERLILRPASEDDRPRLLELFTDPAFTVFSDETHDLGSANARFDRMMALLAHVPYAKQPVVEKVSGRILGYTGVGTVVFDGVDRLEWGWRLATEARGKGYATEATLALLGVADAIDDGEVLCLIDPANEPSRRVADKAGFRWWRRDDGPDGSGPTDLLLRSIGTGGPALLAPHRG